MENIKVKELTVTNTITTNNEIMVLTNKQQNHVQNITVENLLANVLSTDSGNVLEQGTDGKLYVETPQNITGDLADLNTSDKSSLVGAINEISTDMGSLSDLTTTDKNSIVSAINEIASTTINGANKDLSNLSTTGNNRLHALKAYLDNGTLLTDAQGLADVKSIAHSTFDLTKFTVTGNPTVTSDGIASGFSLNNYVTVPNILVDENNFILELVFSTDANLYTSQYQTIFSFGSADTDCIRLTTRNNELVITSANSHFSTGAFAKTLSVNSTYKFVMKIDNGNIYAHLENLTDSTDVFTDVTINITTAINNNYNLTIGKKGYGDAFQFIDGSIDLKNLFIRHNSAPVFTGNQTRQDIYHPINYTLVGTPSISDDGIATGGSGSAIVMSTTPAIATANSWEVQTVYTYNGGGNDPTVFAKSGSTNWTGPSFSVNPSGYFKIYLSSNGTSWNLAETATSLAAVVGTTYYFKVGFTGSTYYIEYNTDGSDTYTNIFSLTSSTKCTCANPLMFLNDGINLTTCYSSGTIDLTKTKVIVNDKVVWEVSPWIKIPYTLSKTGSKIVDSYYRTQVTALTNQEGWAPYYTLSDTDFTLPRGDLYGLMWRTAEMLMPDYDNGISVSSGSFTAPSCGALMAYKTQYHNNDYLYIAYNNITLYTNQAGEYPGRTDKCYCPVIKGKTYSIAYNGNYVVTFYPFIGA